MPDPAAWNRSAPEDASSDVVLYGPEVGSDAEFKLLGTLTDKRVLDLGCGSGLSAVAFARQGARTIAVDFSAHELAALRRRAERESVRIEVHEGDLAELAFIRADSVDLVFSAYALQLVDDLSRVFRQVHRVLKQGCSFVFSLPHPAHAMVDASSVQGPSGPSRAGEAGPSGPSRAGEAGPSGPVRAGAGPPLDPPPPDAPSLGTTTADDVADPSPPSTRPLAVRRSYFDRARIDLGSDSPPFFRHHHTIADLFTGLTRNNFRVDTILEPEPRDDVRSGAWGDTSDWVPRTLIMRARKEGL